MIRPAVPTDAPSAIPLLFQAMQDIACKLAGTEDMAVVTPLFEHFFRQKGNQYSYENTLIFEDAAGIGGMINGYDGAQLDALRKPVLDHIAEKFGHRFLPADETGPGEFYLDSIGVSAERRGQGIGQQLIAAAEERARNEGHRYTGLIVSEANPQAQRLYERLGYVVRNTLEFSGGHYLHLTKAL
ncbi:GNAT family N-acetyltransferase [Chitinophaga lutea]